MVWCTCYISGGKFNRIHLKIYKINIFSWEEKGEGRRASLGRNFVGPGKCGRPALYSTNAHPRNLNTLTVWPSCRGFRTREPGLAKPTTGRNDDDEAHSPYPQPVIRPLRCFNLLIDQLHHTPLVSCTLAQVLLVLSSRVQRRGHCVIIVDSERGTVKSENSKIENMRMVETFAPIVIFKIYTRGVFFSSIETTWNLLYDSFFSLLYRIMNVGVE